LKTLKKKISLFFLIPTLLLFLIFSTISVYLVNFYIKKLAQNKVKYDLNSAHEIYTNELEGIKNIVRFTSRLYLIRSAVKSNDLNTLLAEIQRIRVEEHLDFLSIVDKNGFVLERATNPEKTGDYKGNVSVIGKSLIGEVVGSTEIWSKKYLSSEGSELAEIAKTVILPTPKAIPTEKKVETSGMVLVAAAPVYDSKYRIIGAVYGGILLNKNYFIVDKIKETVFGNKYSGTATIFMGDLRISTNVRMLNGKRAVGTRLSKEVYDRVILNGEKWINRAFVVNAWYITAYEPIFDLKNNIIGSLYVGVLEKPFEAIKYKISIIFITLLAFSSIVIIFISFLFSKKIVAPISNLEKSIKRVANGNYEEFMPISSEDEIGRVEEEFNNMIRALKAKDDALNKLYIDLEEKVQNRTKELERKNRELSRVKNELTNVLDEKEKLLQNYRELQNELIQSSKLAAIGALAGGVAHEINTPVAIIRGNLDLIEIFLEDKGLADSKELELIKEQTLRIEKIVHRLLRISKKSDAVQSEININKLLKDICEPLINRLNIDIKFDFQEDVFLVSYETQLREIFTNIILNAIDAIKEKNSGDLLITTKKDVNAGICFIIFKDSGKGIKEENLRKIFNPFFTTKNEGTGLGLAITLSIIKNMGGDIKIFSEEGKGTEVTIVLNNVNFEA